MHTVIEYMQFTLRYKKDQFVPQAKCDTVLMNLNVFQMYLSIFQSKSF